MDELTNITEKNDTVIMELDRPYVLRFGNKVLKEYCALVHTTMESIDKSILDPVNQQAAAYLMIKQDCVKNGEKPLTPTQVEDLLDRHLKPAKLFYLINKALEAAFTDDDTNEAIRKKKGDTDADPLQAVGTGEEA